MQRFLFRKFSLSRHLAMKFIDIGANLSDPMFQGKYGGSQKHQNDLDIVLNRAWKQGMDKMIITVGTLSEADESLELANKDERLFITMGCHPTRCKEFEPNEDEYFQGLCRQIETNKSKIVAIGECGLDYDRLHFCDKETQKKYFEKQLDLVDKYKLPMFLHCRNAHDDFMDILEKHKELISLTGGVVHSFDGNLEEAKRVIEFGLYIGLNGCSLKTEENLKVVKEIPNDKIMIETDCPWCGIRPSHAGSSMVETKFPVIKKKEKWTCDTLVDGRCEPCQIIQVLEIIAKVKGEDKEKLADIFYENTQKLFFKS